jgi:hypothetical protein
LDGVPPQQQTTGLQQGAATVTRDELHTCDRLLSTDPYHQARRRALGVVVKTAFAIHVHTRLLGRPFRADLYLGPAPIGGCRSCLDLDLRVYRLS